MMLEKAIRNRRAVHSFTGREVDIGDIREAVKVARNAPSAWNIQPWKLFVLESERAQQEAVESSYDQQWMKEADKILLVAGDTEFEVEDRFMDDMVEKGYKTREEVEETREYLEGWSERDFEWKELELTSNCMFFASALMHALFAKGIDSCPVKGFDQSGLRERLELGRWYPVLLLPVGHSDEQKEKKSRKDVGELLETV
jgi:nitroreductase